MKELLLYIAQNLVDHPEQVTVKELVRDDEIIFEVSAEKSDMGKIIGRQGRIIKEIRILMRSVAKRQGKRVSVEIVD